MKNLLIILSLLFSITLTTANATEVSLGEKITGLYVAFFNRAADQEGLDYWTDKGEEAQANGEDISNVLKQLSAGFAGHPTFISTYAHLNNKEFVAAIYRNALGRDGDAEGITYWTDLVDRVMSRSDMVATFVELSMVTDLTPENYPSLSAEELAAAQLRQDLITNKVTVALAFTHQLGESTNVVDSQDPEADPAYLASIKIISEVTEDAGTVSDAVAFLESIINSDDQIGDILSAGHLSSDTTKPVISLTGGTTELFVGEIYTAPTVTASDDVDGDITSSVVVNGAVNPNVVGTYTVTYNVSDTAGNQADTVTHIVTVNEAPDTINPVITLNGESNLILTLGDTYIESGSTATDDKDGNVAVTITGSVDTETVGTYTLTYTATDSAGNTATAGRTVNIVEAPISNRKVTGQVLNYSTGLSVIDINVSAGTETVITDANGSYILPLDDNLTDRIVISVKGNNYASTSKIVSVVAEDNASEILNIDILPVAFSDNFDPTTDFTVQVTDSPANVVIGASSLVLADGSSPVGNIRAELTPIDPALSLDLMPGDMTISSGDPIESFGAIIVEFTDATGNALNLAAGETATIRIPVSTKGESPTASIPLFYYNETDGIWVEEGTAILSSDGTFYEGIVTHFSTWNADTLYDFVIISGCVEELPSNIRIVNANVNLIGEDYIGRTNVRTDADGNFEIRAKQDARSLITATAYRESSNTVSVLTGTSDITLNDCFIIGSPIITLTGGTSTLLLGDTFISPTVTVIDKSNTNLQAIVTGTVDTNTIGTYILRYNVSDAAGNRADEVSFTVTVSETPDLSVFFVGQTKYYINSLGTRGFRNYATDGSYTGSITTSSGTTYNTRGTYEIEHNVLLINNTSPNTFSAELFYMSQVEGGFGFDITVYILVEDEDGEYVDIRRFETYSFSSAAERDAYVSGQ